MKQKIALKVQMNCQKCRTKAMEIAASAEGVISVTIDGEKEQVVVVGEEVDSIDLMSRLRKVGYTNLISVEEVKPEHKKEEPKKPEPEKDPFPKIAWFNDGFNPLLMEKIRRYARLLKNPVQTSQNFTTD
ncbi:heavy metal-associated isoprenylated plant protein 47-like [Magnolia sinica]|uniref:heavy metal-associated isoprenylated plant protein 47-like n=1 Tax=Magnolia sinica TaxID=86752 RepID=UPI00265AA42F|nr:heavy metal-associated isoprenylated plant protein 47-like [Magnolia sinica]